jgi:hypothetical protein
MPETGRVLLAGTQFTCFIDAKVQILTLLLLAVVFPFRPWVECGGMGRRKPPEQILPVFKYCPC